VKWILLPAGSVTADTSNSDLTSLLIFIGIIVIQFISRHFREKP
jgi:hypothetical protein